MDNHYQLIMVGCALSQMKPLELYIIRWSCRAVELFGLKPMHSQGVPKYITRESGGGGSIIATFLLPPRYIPEELNNVGTIFDQRRRR